MNKACKIQTLKILNGNAKYFVEYICLQFNQAIYAF